MAVEAKMAGTKAAERGRRRDEVGRVLSSSMDKTVVVTVHRTASHPRYEKVVRMRATFTAHDERNDCNVGDRVRIRECRPLSRRKRWRVVEILERAPVAGGS